MAVIDIVIIVVLLLFATIGTIKGFLNTILSLFSTIASLAVAILCAKPVAKFLNSVFGIVQKIGGKIASGITNITPFGSNYEAAANGLTGAELKDYINANNPGFKEKVYNLFIEDSVSFNYTETATTAEAVDQNIVQYIGERLAGVISVVIATVAVFILLKIAVLLLSKLFDALTKNRAISGIDRTLGLIFGLAKGALLVCIVLGVAYLVANTTVQGWIDNSTVTRWIYKYVTEFIGYIAHKFELPGYITSIFPAIV